MGEGGFFFCHTYNFLPPSFVLFAEVNKLPTDEQLIIEIRSGSQAAMEVLAKRYYKPIYAYIYRKTGNSHTAYDLTQDVFVKMIRNLSSFSDKGKFSSWLFTIAVNTSRDYYRSAAHRHANADTPYEEYKQGDDGDSVPFIFEKKETRKMLKQAIERLPEMQSEAVLLKYFHNMKIREIADITSSNENTVKARLRQGLGKLKELLGSDNGEQKQS